MASPIEIKENLPDTLPADFGEWDSQDSSVAVPVESPAKQEPVRRESPQRESARREAEALDLANRQNGAREVSREFEPARNVTPFPEPDVAPSTPRGGIPAPVIRAPRNSPAASATAATPVSGDPAYQRLMRSVETVVDKLPPVGTSIPEPKGSTIDLVERKPDRPLFSSAAVAEEASDETSGATLLNDLLEDEEERKTRRKWIMSGCVFGGALLLVSFQLFHYFGSSGKLKHIVPASQPVTAATSNTEPDVDAVSIPDARQASTEKPSAAKTAGNLETSSLDGSADSSQAAEAPAPAVKKPGASQMQMMQTQLSAPTRLPQSVRAMASDAPPPALGGANIAALNGGSAVGNVFSGKSDPRVSGPKPILVSAGVASGMLIHKTQPVYPSIARSARVQGTVTLTATITSTGKVANIRVVSGPPMLRQSAIDAVKTWVYKPYALNGYPTDVETTVNLVFSLGS